jgi:hypothetical protein
VFNTSHQSAGRAGNRSRDSSHGISVASADGETGGEMTHRLLGWIHLVDAKRARQSRAGGSSSSTLWLIAVSLVALLSPGCIAYYGGYGGPSQKSEVTEELARELRSRDLKFDIEFTCPGSWAAPSTSQEQSGLSDCWRSAAAMRSLMLDLEMFWTPDDGSPEPQYKIDIVLADEGSKLALLNFITALNLWIVIPMYVPVTQHIGGVISEPGRTHQDREIIKEARQNLARIDELRWRPPFSQPIVSSEQEIVASTASSYSTLYSTSFFLPTAWLGGRGHRAALFLGQPMYFPGTRDSIEAMAPVVLLELVRQLPQGGEEPEPEPSDLP